MIKSNIIFKNIIIVILITIIITLFYTYDNINNFIYVFISNSLWIFSIPSFLISIYIYPNIFLFYLTFILFSVLNYVLLILIYKYLLKKWKIDLLLIINIIFIIINSFFWLFIYWISRQ